MLLIAFFHKIETSIKKDGRKQQLEAEEPRRGRRTPLDWQHLFYSDFENNSVFFSCSKTTHLFRGGTIIVDF